MGGGSVGGFLIPITVWINLDAQQREAQRSIRSAVPGAGERSGPAAGEAEAVNGLLG